MPDVKKHYPSTRYHPKHGAVRVESEEHEAETAHPEKGWVETPADFPPPPPPDPTKCATCGQTLPNLPDADATDVATDAKPKRTPKAPKGE